MKVKAVNTESAPTMTDCLGTSLILRKILKYFSTTELLKLSLVNKLWNYEARIVLRDQGRLSAKMKRGRSLCRNLRAFASDLRKMNVIPFTGLTIDQGTVCFANDHKGGWNICSNMDPIYEDILDRLLWKNLRVQLLENWDKHKKCTGLQMVKQILDNFCGELEELSLLVTSNGAAFLQEFLQGSSFPRLHTLKLQNTDYYTTREDFMNLIKVLVSRAPNLQVLHTRGRINLHENLLEGSSSAVHVMDFGFAPYLDEIPDNIVGRLKLKRMKFLSHGQVFGLERLNRTMLVALQTSRTILTSVDIEEIFLVTLMYYGICLENVQELRILLDSHRSEPFQREILRLVKDFDVTRLFPRLTQVKSSPYYSRAAFTVDEINEMLQQWSPNLHEPFKSDRAAIIKTLSLSAYLVAIDDFTLRFLSEMLPNIENITVGPCQFIPYSLLWQHYWVALKELTFQTFGTSSPRSYFNFDSLFCGIFPEEVAQLQKMDEEYLRSVNIVPVMPSITYLKGLRSFKFLYTEINFSDQTNDPTYMFSKVAALIAFQRCPHLAVTLEVDDKRLARSLSHMKPYAEVKRHNQRMTHILYYL